MRAYVTMLPRLQAEEALSALSVGSLSSSFASAKDVSAAVRRLQAVAGGGRKPRRKATPQMLAAMGIATVSVPAEPDAKEANTVSVPAGPAAPASGEAGNG
ncbi:hypothetical protein [Polymorphum gilvum]|uniref:Uncharacterized protein n=1 Tax=Polymorphum gilvum (strain LMG 25793 / CGMCC 1.9160 / SL003B-26A1) TaxID=991905 RepID=F2J5P1_POLGS|nr:hypothetical protein [Polymorphum gilvum]ADZ70125.1 hypothetical protein SL003B_1697 [Polymorphum gilvum SL003B-26A1]